MERQQKFLGIELYTDSNGNMDLLDDMTDEKKSRFIKKNEDLEKLPFPSFIKSKLVWPIPNMKGFYELRYLFSDPPFRGIAFIHKSFLVILCVFQGSGSNGKLNKHLPKAKRRALDWASRHK